ncbi:hypothetical protein [Magnetospirillum sp. SS-4]|uniref:hypothetical protein n=1 Tax=Magnetospirillum sp. SS-4 TaxID=2681465 RepID=UPI00157367C7|nr:hypothetical protein [Magnetospirillum sp. SS-4]
MSLPPDTVGRVLVCANDDVQGAGKAHAAEIANHFGQRATRVRLSKSNPVGIADAMMANIGTVAEGGRPVRCVVDISTFTHEALLILLRVLQFTLPANSEVTYVYTPAKEYDPGTPTEAKWLSRGLGGVRSVLGYSGTWLPSRKIHLIVLVGFESDRARKLVEAYEPDALSLGIGCVGPLSATLEDVRKVFYQEIAEAFPQYSDFEFTPGDPFAVRDVLLAHIDKFPGHNTVIAPMNTKISTIGAAMAAFEREDVQLTYGSAGIYNTDNYSVAEDHCMVFTIPSFPV